MQNNSNWNLHTNNLWIIIKLFPFEWRSEENLFRWFCAFFFIIDSIGSRFYLVVVVFVPSSDTSETGITGNRKSLELDCLRINILFNFLGENYHTVNKIRERPRECGWAGEKFIERICVWFLHWIGLFSVLYWVSLRWSHTRKKQQMKMNWVRFLCFPCTLPLIFSLSLYSNWNTHTQSFALKDRQLLWNVLLRGVRFGKFFNSLPMRINQRTRVYAFIRCDRQ